MTVCEHRCSVIIGPARCEVSGDLELQQEFGEVPATGADDWVGAGQLWQVGNRWKHGVQTRDSEVSEWKPSHSG